MIWLGTSNLKKILSHRDVSNVCKHELRKQTPCLATRCHVSDIGSLNFFYMKKTLKFMTTSQKQGESVQKWRDVNQAKYNPLPRFTPYHGYPKLTICWRSWVVLVLKINVQFPKLCIYIIYIHLIYPMTSQKENLCNESFLNDRVCNLHNPTFKLYSGNRKKECDKTNMYCRSLSNTKASHCILQELYIYVLRQRHSSK